MQHSKVRALERYSICSFKPGVIINIIRKGLCVFLKTDVERFSHHILLRYGNRYIIVVTDYNIQFVKTVIPYDNKHDEALGLLVQQQNLER